MNGSPVKLGRDDFLSRLKAVQPGLSQREILEQSSCLVFKGGMVLTYNDEVSCRFASGLPQDAVGAVKAKPLIALLEKLKEEQISLTFNDQGLELRGNRRGARFTLEKDILLQIGAVEKPGPWRPLPQGFNEAVEMASQCAGTDQSKFALTCLNLHPQWVEACDNYQLTRYRVETGLARPMLVRAESLRHVVPLGMTELSESPAWVHFRNPAKLILSCRRYLEEYPDLTGLLTVKGTPVTLPKGLVETVEQAEIFTSENAEANYIRVELRPGELRIRGLGVTAEFWQTYDLNYRGDPQTFLITPRLLSRIVQRHNDVEITPDRLKVDGGRWRYVAYLGAADAQPSSEPEAGVGVGGGEEDTVVEPASGEGDYV